MDGGHGQGIVTRITRKRDGDLQPRCLEIKGAKRAKGGDTKFFLKQLSATSGNVSAVVSAVVSAGDGWCVAAHWPVGGLGIRTVYCVFRIVVLVGNRAKRGNANDWNHRAFASGFSSW